jgi:hypothetical protein
MKETSEQSEQPSFPGMSRSICSPASAAGRSPFVLPDSPGQSGPPASPASLFHKPVGAEVLRTSATFGLMGENSSPSSGLQKSLENRLLQRMEKHGSPEFVLTWKHSDMPSGPPICALRASEPPIDDSACTGWRSPQHSDGEGGVMEIRPGTAGKYKLRDEAMLAAWPTPNTMTGGQTSRGGDRKDEKLMGGLVQGLASWATPKACDGAHPSGMSRIRQEQGKSADSLRLQTKLVGWPTPRTPTGGPESAERKKELGRMESGGGDLQAAALGTTVNSSNAPTGKPVALNAAFPRWLMSFPRAWDEASPNYADWLNAQELIASGDSRDTGTPSSPSSPQSSSAHTSNPGKIWPE